MTKSEPFRALVVDDEAPARKRLLQLLKKDPEVQDVLEAPDGMAAVDIIQEEHPNLLFLDVRMPQLDGFGVIKSLADTDMPYTVFVTGYDSYAVRAFEEDATDYLVKPFSDTRFSQTMARVKARIGQQEKPQFSNYVTSAVTANMPAEGLWDRLVVKSGGIARFVPAIEIDWIEGADVYVNLHIHGKEVLYRASLRELASRLDPTRFVRIHRSTIVNIERIQHLESLSHGDFEVVLTDGHRLQLSRRFRSELEKRLGQSL